MKSVVYIMVIIGTLALATMAVDDVNDKENAQERLSIGAVVGLHDEPDGLIVTPFMGFPAWEAGLRPGDIITQIDRQQATDPDQISQAIAQSKDGRIAVRWVRRNERGRFRSGGGTIRATDPVPIANSMLKITHEAADGRWCGSRVRDQPMQEWTRIEGMANVWAWLSATVCWHRDEREPHLSLSARTYDYDRSWRPVEIAERVQLIDESGTTLTVRVGRTLKPRQREVLIKMLASSNLRARSIVFDRYREWPVSDTERAGVYAALVLQDFHSNKRN